MIYQAQQDWFQVMENSPKIPWIENFFRIFVVDDNPHSLPTLESWHSGRHFLHSEALVPFQWVKEGPFTRSRGIPSRPARSPVSLTLVTSQSKF